MSTVVPARWEPDHWDSTKVVRTTDDTDMLIRMGVNASHRGHVMTHLKEPFSPMADTWLTALSCGDVYRPSTEVQLAHGMPDMAGRILVLYGPPGTGKTIAAIRVLLAAVRLEIPNEDPDQLHSTTRYRGLCQGHWFDWQDLSELFRRNSSGEFTFDDMAWSDADLLLRGGSLGDHYEQAGGQFLVVDDVSRERSTEFNLDKLQYYLRYRQRHGFGTILTTNLAPTVWESYLGPSLGNFLIRSSMWDEFSGSPGVLATPGVGDAPVTRLPPTRPRAGRKS